MSINPSDCWSLCKRLSCRCHRCVQAAFNWLVCCYALGDKEGMAAAFQRLLTVPGLAEAKAMQVRQLK